MLVVIGTAVVVTSGSGLVGFDDPWVEWDGSWVRMGCLRAPSFEWRGFVRGTSSSGKGLSGWERHLVGKSRNKCSSGQIVHHRPNDRARRRRVLPQSRAERIQLLAKISHSSFPRCHLDLTPATHTAYRSKKLYRIDRLLGRRLAIHHLRLTRRSDTKNTWPVCESSIDRSCECDPRGHLSVLFLQACAAPTLIRRSPGRKVFQVLSERPSSSSPEWSTT